MATVGSLLVVLRADTSPFTRDLNKATNVTSSFASALTTKLIGGAAILRVLDDATRELTNAFKDVVRNGTSAGEAIRLAFENTLRGASQSLPVVGNLSELLEEVSDVGQATKGWRDFADTVNRIAHRLSPSVLEVIPTGPSAFQREQNAAAVTAQIVKAEREHQALLAEAQRLTESLMTAEERRNAQVARARHLFDVGAISAETFNRVMHEQVEEVTAIESPLQALLDNLREQAVTWGMTARQIDLYRASAQGADNATLDVIDAMHDHIDALGAARDAQRDMQDAAAEVFDATRTPLERYGSAIDDLNALLEAGLISWQTYGRGVRMARKELEEVLRRSPAESALMALGDGSIDVGAAGSFAGRNVIDRSRDQVADNTKRQLELTQRELQHLESIDSKIQRDPIIVQEVTI